MQTRIPRGRGPKGPPPPSAVGGASRRHIKKIILANLPTIWFVVNVCICVSGSLLVWGLGCIVIWWAGQLAPKLFEFMFLGMLAPNLKEDPWAGGPLIINSYLMEDEIRV